MRVERFGSHTLYLGDFREVIPSLGKVDSVITDPPYESHMHAAKGDGKKKIRTDGSKEIEALDFSAIGEIRKQVVPDLSEICEGWFLAFCTPEGVAAWRDAIEDAGAKYKRACIWVKPDSAPQFNGQGPAMGAECFVSAWCASGHSRWNGGGRRNVFTHPCNPSGRTGEHPTEKPVSLMLELVDLFTFSGDTVLDPFMGSGTTGIACAKAGRHFIGIEEKEKYFDLSCRRMEAALLQGEMFSPHSHENHAKNCELF